MASIIRISKKPAFIIVTCFKDDYIYYYLDNLKTKNIYCDIGVWNIKYK